MSYTFRSMVLPDDTKESIDRYVEQGMPPGHFLQACIKNDLLGAIKRADEIHIHLLPAIVAYLFNECPSLCWGSPALYEQFIEQKRAERESILAGEVVS